MFGGQMFLCHPAMSSTDYKSKCPGKSLGLILLLGECNGCMSCSGMFQLEVQTLTLHEPVASKVGQMWTLCARN